MPNIWYEMMNMDNSSFIMFNMLSSFTVYVFLNVFDNVWPHWRVKKVVVCSSRHRDNCWCNMGLWTENQIEGKKDKRWNVVLASFLSWNACSCVLWNNQFSLGISNIYKPSQLFLLEGKLALTECVCSNKGNFKNSTFW